MLNFKKSTNAWRSQEKTTISTIAMVYSVGDRHNIYQGTVMVPLP